MSGRHKSRRQCSHDNCGSHKFNVGGDGFTYCDQGHQQSDLGTVIAQDTGEFVAYGRRVRKAGSDVESVTSKASGLSGARAFEHYLLCLQLVLRKQLRWLVNVQKLPAELEDIVRDLWSLRLQKQHSKISHDSDSDTEAHSSHKFSSQSEGESGTDTTASRRSRTADQQKPRGPSLTELLCLIYVGTLLLRIPITIADLQEWVTNGELLFYRAAKEVPLKMRERLPGHYQEQLEPQDLVTPLTLHSRVLDVLATLSTEFGMVVPALNHSLILYRWIRKLALPLEVFVATERLARELGVDFIYSINAKKWTSTLMRFPEIRLMALTLIATKLFFPFDDTKRYPRSATDFAALKMDWSRWSDAQGHQPEQEDEQTRQPSAQALSFASAFSLTETDSLELADNHLDQYLDWCDGNLASNEVRERGRASKDADFRKALFRMFPTKENSSSVAASVSHAGQRPADSSSDRILQVQGSLRAQRIVRDDEADDVPRPGSSHRQYRQVEELEGAVKIFYHKAAQSAGCSLQDLLKAVLSTERKLLGYRKAKREDKADADGGAMNESAQSA